MKTPINFLVPHEDELLISAIAARAVQIAERDGITYSRLEAEMDLTACHANGCPLDLPRLLRFADPDFGHDIYGIRRYLDRATGRLTGIFAPRSCAPEQAAA